LPLLCRMLLPMVERVCALMSPNRAAHFQSGSLACDRKWRRQGGLSIPRSGETTPEL